MSIVKVDCEDLSKHPSCPHGPTLKFFRQSDESEVRGFYACSAYRDRKGCPFFMWDCEELTPSKLQFVEELKSSLIPDVNRKHLNQVLSNIRLLPEKDRRYCPSCGVLFVSDSVAEHSEHPGFVDKPITNELLKNPSTLLVPLSSDKKEAQYWFSKDTTETIISIIAKESSVLCIGTPRVHETCCAKGIKSLLLDFDHRLLQFYNENQMLWFNMFNFHFMDDTEKSLDTLKHFLSLKPLVIVDPPFGARLEGLNATINKLKSFFEEVNSGMEMKFILVQPYFMIPKVSDMNLGLTMCNYVVDYENHRFKKKKSPVRLFANFNILLTHVGKICPDCSKWVTNETEHCYGCEICPPGENYKHCYDCSKCVKSSWKHCKWCKFCVVATHDCKPKKLKKQPKKSRNKRFKTS